MKDKDWSQKFSYRFNCQRSIIIERHHLFSEPQLIESRPKNGFIVFQSLFLFQNMSFTTQRRAIENSTLDNLIMAIPMEREFRYSRMATPIMDILTKEWCKDSAFGNMPPITLQGFTLLDIFTTAKRMEKEPWFREMDCILVNSLRAP